MHYVEFNVDLKYENMSLILPHVHFEVIVFLLQGSKHSMSRMEISDAVGTY